MKIQIDYNDFKLPCNAQFVHDAITMAKAREDKHQIIKALIERFPAVKDMDLEDLLQFIAVLPTMHDVQVIEERLTREHFKMKARLTEELSQAKAACRAVSDARLSMTDGSLSNEIESAIEVATKIAYANEVRPYPPALEPVKVHAGVCTCNHCQQQQQPQAISIGGATFVSGGDTEP